MPPTLLSFLGVGSPLLLSTYAQVRSAVTLPRIIAVNGACKAQRYPANALGTCSTYRLGSDRRCFRRQLLPSEHLFNGLKLKLRFLSVSQVNYCAVPLSGNVSCNTCTYTWMCRLHVRSKHTYSVKGLHFSSYQEQLLF